jgi:hypothetical protein
MNYADVIPLLGPLINYLLEGKSVKAMLEARRLSSIIKMHKRLEAARIEKDERNQPKN